MPEYTYKQLAKKWGVSLRTARRRVEKAGYPVREEIKKVTQEQKVSIITVEE